MGPNSNHAQMDVLDKELLELLEEEVETTESEAPSPWDPDRVKVEDWSTDSSTVSPPSVLDRLTLETLPSVRGDCHPGGKNQMRPCPWLCCYWHLGHFGDNSCVLDIADHGGTTLEEVGDAMGITRERVRQIEEVALRKLLQKRHLGLIEP